MKKLLTKLECGLMLVLALAPAVIFVSRAVLTHMYTGFIWFAVQTLTATLIALLPGYVGNYTETEIIRYEGGRRNNDPNPDRESVHELVREGHRFPVRLPVSVVYLMLTFAACMFLPGRLFLDSTIRRVVFAGVMFVLNMTALYGAASYCIFTELPGMGMGFLIYVGSALYLNFSKADNSDIQLIISICALAYLFIGGVCLNRATLQTCVSTGDNTRSAPRQIIRKNRRIVLGFATAAAVVSFVGPIRSAAIWLFTKFMTIVKAVLRFLGGGGGEAADDALPEMLTGYAAGDSSATVVEETGETGSMLFVYIFFGLVGLGMLWIIFDGLRKLINKLTKLLERFAAGMSEGYYDEREEIVDPSEAGRRLSGLLKDRLRKLLTRETPWEKLSPREKARRLLRDVYKKHGKRVKRLAAFTAREAIAEMKLDKTGLAELYERARYSEHEVKQDEPDNLRKEIRP